jgi:hypothetical protein
MDMDQGHFRNPFRPGAGHMPPFLAGRDSNIIDFARLLEQHVILENVVLTGLRGVGKTVLLETFKPRAIAEGWLWAGTDLSESFCVTEDRFAMRILTDLAPLTSSWAIGSDRIRRIGFDAEIVEREMTLNFAALDAIYQQTPGLVADKIKRVLKIIAELLPKHEKRGLIFAYDEAQNLADHAGDSEYPLSMLLDVFQSLQRSDIPFMLVLTGLPTLFPKLVEARTYAERMFRVVFLDRLDDRDSAQAIVTPIDDQHCPVRLSTEAVDTIVQTSGGYPYFIQFICKEGYDFIIQNFGVEDGRSVPLDEILRKLDTDFFAGRWARATDRQRDLLTIISTLESCDAEFTVQEIVEASKISDLKSFSSSHVNQMLASLAAAGLVYRNRHGRYSLAVPLMGEFIKRQLSQ